MKNPLQLFTAAAFCGLTVVFAENTPDTKTPPATNAPAEAQKSAPVQDLANVGDPTRKKVEELPEAKRTEFIKHLNEASRLINTIRLQEALSSVISAEVIQPDVFVVQNLKGAIYTKMRLFDEAGRCFERALKLFPSAFQPKFNLAEIEFVKQNFPKAEKLFLVAIEASEAEEKRIQDFIKAQPADTNPFILNSYDNQLISQKGTTSLLKFKVLCSKLRQNQLKEAEKYQESFHYLEETPAYWLSKAAVAFAKNNKDEANEHIAASRRIFPEAQVGIFLDSFIELGWIETLSK